jgi:hypothetical protein
MEMNELLNKYYQDGEVCCISVRPARKENVMVLGEVNAIAGKGLEGDRYNSDGIRQVTLIQEEHLKAI